MNDALTQISLAKVRLFAMQGMVFTASLCSQLETVLDTTVAYGATDGKKLLINPDSFLTLSKDEQVFLLAHETLHCAYLHMCRLNDKDPYWFNVACDYVINLELVLQGFSMIQGGFIDSQYSNMSAEEVYDLLDKTNPPDLEQDLIYGASQEEILPKIISSAQQAQQSKDYGSIPDSVQRLLQQLHKPKINWRVVLQRFMVDTTKSDYTWTRPNKKLLSQGFYLPSLNQRSLTQISIAIDVSVSISNEMFETFVSEVANIFKTFPIQKLEIILFNTQVILTKTVKSIKELKDIDFMGYGGTDVTDTLKQFSQSQSKALLVITDGFFDTNLVNPKKPILWLIYDNPEFKIDFGKITHFKME